MAVRVDGDERKAEIQRRGRLHDSQTALSPLRVYRMHRFVTGDGDRDLRAPPPAAIAWGWTVCLDQSPSITPAFRLNMAKVGDDSTGGRPSNLA